MSRHCFVYCSVCRWQHMLRYTSESLESNLRCFFDLNINTGNWKLLFRSPIRCFLTNWPLLLTVALTVLTGWAKPKQSGEQPSSPALPGKQTGVREEGFCHRWTELVWLLTPVVVHVWTFRFRIKKPPIKKWPISQKKEKKLHILNSSTWYICPLTVAKFVCCCVLALMPAECCCWAIACVFSKLMYLVIAGLLAHAPPF